ncbi:MAG: hypothetical protein KKB30_00690 [Proteobacteria bacterium]|nr:hypothetical protein [Pseudomonadota bacterium]MBU1715329.1 hypothetical protein [Pseudomonadota bacterium]
MRTVCCVCDKIIKQQTGLAEEKSADLLSHGYCQPCFENTIRKITNNRTFIEQNINPALPKNI